MRFLVISKSRSPLPPDMAASLIEAQERFAEKMVKSGKAEQTFSLAGYIGGGAILNVESHEELDTIMTEFPLGPFSHSKIYALADLPHWLAESKKVAQQRSAQS
jgi:muconolactone delta-isomerase